MTFVGFDSHIGREGREHILFLYLILSIYNCVRY